MSESGKFMTHVKNGVPLWFHDSSDQEKSNGPRPASNLQNWKFAFILCSQTRREAGSLFTQQDMK